MDILELKHLIKQFKFTKAWVKHYIESKNGIIKKKILQYHLRGYYILYRPHIYQDKKKYIHLCIILN